MSNCSICIGENKMERMNCVLIEDNILEFVDEIQQQINKKLVCCKCPNPCDGNSRCALAMKNLSVDINMFTAAYKEHNEEKEEEV